ncbi:Gfo/Idh/MocA family protein [[Clostridium] fimetarium]|uniref:Predicted dehydrogenase n=1 Tax=[Clostridium] fimetarium TaxID=99656 RepID=A0A1I0RB39_9FIRM|nr:Gfo/Idh/MocA family oxidoreductase [[Clostridium] fimetarium]SEW38013.1 Predicted dehydrogenase [[Clostridium] fimetarium]
MGKSKFIIIGSGWRSMYYVRIAKALPEMFELCAMYCRTTEKAEKIARENNIHTTTSIEECVSYSPDFVVVAVNKTSIYEVSKEWMKKGFAVLCETPPSLKLEELQDLWQMHEQGAKLQVAEQYFLYPTYKGKLDILDSKILGDPYNVTISAIHDYHAASIIRKILGTGFENVTIYGKKHKYPVTETLTRYESLFDGRVADKERDRLTFEFENGKMAFYDFSSIQYRSTIRSLYMQVQGIKGEMVNDTFRYLDEENMSHESEITIEKFESGQIESVKFEGKSVYQCPYNDCGLSEDETAIAGLMSGMKEYSLTCKEVYPLADAMQDAYITILMQEALANPNQEIKMQSQNWMM